MTGMPKERQRSIIYKFTTRVSVSAQRQSQWCGQELRGPSVKAVVLMKVKVSARARRPSQEVQLDNANGYAPVNEEFPSPPAPTLPQSAMTKLKQTVWIVILVLSSSVTEKIDLTAELKSGGLDLYHQKRSDDTLVLQWNLVDILNVGIGWQIFADTDGQSDCNFASFLTDYYLKFFFVVIICDIRSS